MDSNEPPTLHSRRALSLRFNIPVSKTYRFWDSLREGRFLTTKCKDCGEVSFPPQVDCPNCMSSDVEWIELSTEAELLSYTYVQVTPTSFVDRDPYLVAIGRLEGGLNVLAWIEGATLEKLKPGLRLRLEARAGAKDQMPYYVFVPVR